MRPDMKHTSALFCLLALLLGSCSLSPVSSSSGEATFGSSSTNPDGNDTSSKGSLDVEEGYVSSITFPSDSVSVATKRTIKLEPTVLPLDALDRSVTFSSSDKSVATVDKNGLVYGWKVGKAIITATANDGAGAAGSVEVNVVPVEVEEISLTSSRLSLAPGESKAVEFEVLPSDAANKNVNFLSDDESVCTFENGIVTGIVEGSTTCYIIADNGVEAVLTVTVASHPLRDAYFRSRIVDLSLGERRALDPVIVPLGGNASSLSYLSNDPSTVAIENGELVAKKVGSATVTLTSPASVSSMTVNVVADGALKRTNLRYSYQDLVDNSVFATSYAPTGHEAKFLIVPVWFSDSSSYIASSKKEAVREDIERAFLSKDDSSVLSVASYYEQESFGTFEITGTVTDWYAPGSAARQYGNNQNATRNLVTSAFDWAKKNDPTLDPKDYDRDADGYVDALILVYAAPDYVSASSNFGNFWAYTGWVGDASKRDVEDPYPNVFHWASYDFMYGSNAYEHTGFGYGGGDTTYVDIDTHTFIHEVGHVFGLDDYYDYSGQYVPAGGFSMQDYNVGAHDPYSVMALGWADPFIPTSSCEITLRPFATSGDLVLLTPAWNDLDSPFDEYLLLEYYDEVGLNEADAKHAYRGGYPTGPGRDGIRLWHVDARLLYSYDGRTVSASEWTVDPYDERGPVVRMMSNTYYSSDNDPITYLGKDYADYNLLQLIRDSKEATYHDTYAISGSELFVPGESFSMEEYASQFVRGSVLNDGGALGWSFSVLSKTSDGIKVSIVKE